ncbi:C-C motif chemokine 19-like [Strigops habroptila]|uniref:C-C motif chemokine 19-like n=1 Tax=Strigops habroptila TaxID=2489341 RepID=UPI0011CFEF5A|nr:C-C motif chemokine 19-like [Strigops habroptila]
MQKLQLLCLSLLMLGCILDVHGGNNVLDCCLRTKDTLIPRRIVQDYWLQLVQDGCDIPAAVFITTKGKRLCAPPQAPWVLRLQQKLDASFARKPAMDASLSVDSQPELLEWPVDELVLSIT